MVDLIKRAKELLESSEIKVVIGYEDRVPEIKHVLFLLKKPEDADKLIFDSRCVQNLAAYITKKEVTAKGKMAIAATLPVMRSIIQLASEFQVNDSNLLVLGITPESKLSRIRKSC
jgi:hypothetical protein